MDVRGKLVGLLNEMQDSGIVETPAGFGFTKQYIENDRIASHLIAHGVTVQEWISVKDRTPTEADGTVWVCLADVFPYNKKEPYIDAKHDRRITEAHYDEFSKRWHKEGAVLPAGIVTHWMEKPQPPKED